MASFPSRGRTKLRARLRKLKKSHAAKSLKMSPSTLYNICGGHQNPTIFQAALIEELFSIPLRDWIVGIDGKPLDSRSGRDWITRDERTHSDVPIVRRPNYLDENNERETDAR